MAGWWIPWKSIAILLAIAVSKCSSFGSVPLFLWSNAKDISLSSKELAVGQEASLTEAKIHVSNFLGSSKATVLFLQDKLSFDDLTKYGRKTFNSKSSVFENLQQIFENNAKIILPSIVKRDDEKSLVPYLQKQFAGKVSEIYSSDIESWRYNDAALSGKHLFIFHLIPLKGSTENGKMSILSRNDDLVGKIISEFKKHLVYSAILTAAEPSDIVERMQSGGNGETELKRHLLSVKSSANGQLFNFSNCVYIYANSIKLSIAGSSAEFMNATTTPSGKCSNNQSTVSLVFTKNLPANVTQFELRMTFVKLANTDWACSMMDVTYSGTLNKTEQTNVNFDFPNCPAKVTAPKTMSYSCGNLDLRSVNNTATLSLGRFQVQPFGIKDERFSNAYDCVSFFTIPILTGLFVSALLISIVFGGIFAMMGISTMDRFDDPKGPTIQVPHE